jgi:hypothetical protein
MQVWSVLVPVVGVERVLDMFRDWMSRFASHWPKEDASSLIEARLGAVCDDAVFDNRPFRDGEEHKEGHGAPKAAVAPASPPPARTSWSCESCLYSGNGSSSAKCAGCGEKGKPWVCGQCQKVNKVNVFQCTACGSNGHGCLDAEVFATVEATAVTPVSIVTSLEGQDPSILFNGDPSTHLMSGEAFFSWVECSIPGDLVLDSLDFYVDSQDAPAYVRVIGVSADLFKGSRHYCRGKGCNFAPNSHPSGRGYCCSTCQTGTHSLNCSSSCRKSCSFDHKNSICRRCQQPASQHVGPSRHSCENGGRGVFCYFSNPVSRVQEEVKSNPGLQKDTDLSASLGWTSILSKDDCMQHDIKSVFISFSKKKGIDKPIRISSMRMNGRECSISLGKSSDWRCASCFGLSKRRAGNQSNCSSCRARFPTTLSTVFAGKQFLEGLSLNQKKTLWAQVAYSALLQNVSEIVTSEQLESDDDIIELRKWRLQGTPSKGNKLSVEFQTETSTCIHMELCMEGKIYVMYVRNGAAGARTRLTYSAANAQWTLTETNRGLVLKNEAEGGKIQKIPAAPIKSHTTSNITVIEIVINNPVAGGDVPPAPGGMPVAHSADESEDEDSDDSEEEDDVDVHLEIALNAIISDYVDFGDIPPPQPISASSDSLRMQSVFFWSTSSLEGFDSLKRLIEAKDRDHCTSAHLAAYCGLHRTVATLFANGASRWSTNRAGHTPMGLLCGVKGDARVFTLHKLCCLGNFFGLDSANSVTAFLSPAVECLLRCPAHFDIEQPFADILSSILAGESELALETLADITDESTHFRVYKALASLYAGYGVKGCALHLSTYVDNITALAKDGADTDTICLNPLYFYVRYAMWKTQSGPESSSKVPMRFLHLFYCYLAYCCCTGGT